MIEVYQLTKRHGTAGPEHRHDEPAALLPGYLTAHLQVTLAARAVATGVSVPLGLLATRVRWLGGRFWGSPV